MAVEPELIERLLADAASEPGILPLLQETLVQLWDARVDQTLPLADYQALGDGERSGLAVALARRADATFRGLLDPVELADAELWQQTESAVQLGRAPRSWRSGPRRPSNAGAAVV